VASARNERHRRQARWVPKPVRTWESTRDGPPGERPNESSWVDCGWGRLIFAHTYPTNQAIADELRQEEQGRRDIAMYLRDPHVVLALAPQELFLDPSHTYRLLLDQYRPSRAQPKGFLIRKLNARTDTGALNAIYAQREMVQVDPAFYRLNRHSRTLTFLVAEDASNGEVIGVVTGVDHKRAFNDPENGSSLWSLAVDPKAHQPGIGEALSRRLAEHYQARGRAFMDLSVMHDNKEAIALYEKLGFVRVPVFAIKTKNPINEHLFTGPAPDAKLNPYAKIIVDEARRRGIAVEVLDEENGYFALSQGGRTIVCRESLSELTTAIAMSRCDDKAVTRKILAKAGLRMPAQRLAGTKAENKEFLDQCGAVVVKPARGEQGAGVHVDLRTITEVQRCVKAAQKMTDKVLLEEYSGGQDLRVIVIDYRVVAAAVRLPAQIAGNGRDTVRKLIEKQSRRRAAATGGESRIPVDEETRRCVKASGYGLDDVPPAEEVIEVRKTANLHTGGTIHDVTDEIGATIRDAAVTAAKALEIPVVGFDFLTPDIRGNDYVIIEANERPGLANHEPAPTAERFIDLLFPMTASR